MSTTIADELKRELVARGFDSDLEAPQGTMGLTESYSTASDLADLLDVMVSRREKILRSVDVVGMDAAKKSLDDVLIAIAAIKTVLGKLSLA